MRIQSPTEPILDPFFAVVRRRHPDVDLVMLPPEAPQAPPADADLVTDEVVLAVVDQVAELFVRLWDLAGLMPPTEPRVTRHGAHGTDVVVVARASAAVVDDGAALDRVTAGLVSAGWAVRELAGAVRRTTASLDDLDATVSWAAPTGVLVVTAASRPLPVGADRLRALVRAGAL